MDGTPSRGPATGFCSALGKAGQSPRASLSSPNHHPALNLSPPVQGELCSDTLSTPEHLLLSSAHYSQGDFSGGCKTEQGEEGRWDLGGDPRTSSCRDHSSPASDQDWAGQPLTSQNSENKWPFSPLLHQRAETRRTGTWKKSSGLRVRRLVPVLSSLQAMCSLPRMTATERAEV